MISCPNCGQENPEGFRLCGMCGTALAAEPAAREERKVVTVLFCDLVGFTAKGEQLDPEDVRAILGHYHTRVRSELERHGGTVEKFIGDAVMALFGAPVAHEDDPERAAPCSRPRSSRRCWSARKAIRSTPSSSRSSTSSAARPRTCHFPRRCRESSLRASTASRRTRRPSSRTPPSSARSSGPVRCERDEREATPLLHALERKGFLTRQRRSSVESEGEWAFAHMLLRDVAYGQIPRADRAHKHRETAEWIESLGRPHDHAELLAFHWSSALELSCAAGQPADDLTTPTRLALRAAGDRAFSVNAYPAAAGYYSDAIALWPEDDEERPHLLYRYAEALYVVYDDKALSSLEEARDALLAVGDRKTAAEAEISVSRVWWHRGRKDEASAHEAHAEELAGTAASPATARVLASIARGRSIGGEPEEGLRLAREALAMAEALELDELRAHALATIGLSKGYLGDPTGRRDEERALELALAAHSPQAGSIANNVAVQAVFAFDLRRAGELFDEGRAIAERFGDASGVRWLQSQQAAFALILGRWDEALRGAEEFIAECEAGSPHYLEGATRVCRARVREGRGDIGGALADYRRAVAVAREAQDPQELLPAVGAAVAAYETYGDPVEARDLAQEVAELAGRYPHDAVWSLTFEFLFSRVAVDFERVLRDALETSPLGPWRDLALACLDRDFVRAAEMWAAAGSPTWEARLRMRAAEELIETGRRAEGKPELRKALAFYRTVGATFYINRGEQLLAKSA